MILPNYTTLHTRLRYYHRVHVVGRCNVSLLSLSLFLTLIMFSPL
jgi:hypothetical protein